RRPAARGGRWRGRAGAPDDDERDLAAQLLATIPVVDLVDEVGAYHDREAVLRMARLERAHRAQRAALAAEIALDVADARPRPQRRGGQLAHAEAILERLERLVERVLEAGDQPQLVDGGGLEHVERGQLVADVRRVEAAPEERDPHSSLH